MISWVCRSVVQMFSRNVLLLNEAHALFERMERILRISDGFLNWMEGNKRVHESSNRMDANVKVIEKLVGLLVGVVFLPGVLEKFSPTPLRIYWKLILTQSDAVDFLESCLGEGKKSRHADMGEKRPTKPDATRTPRFVEKIGELFHRTLQNC